ncbi:hypothetical protein [Clostridium sp. FP1]|nr:hypothetical protein [Clostridium sp. FP1]
MTNDKDVYKIIDIISEMILKYVEECKENQCDGEEVNIQVA